MAKIWVLQNAQPENLGIAGQVLQSYGLAPAYVRTVADAEAAFLHFSVRDTGIGISADHNVTVVGDGLQALAAVEKERFDLLLMDVLMPGMDGLEATNAMKGDEEHCLEAGMDAYIAKPIDPERLFEVIREMVSA